MNCKSLIKPICVVCALLPLTTHAAQPLLDLNASFTTMDQSIWSTGDAFNESFTQFIGPNINVPTSVIGAGSSDSFNLSVPIPGPDPTWNVNPYFQYRGNFKAGLEFGAEINGGSINAILDYGLGLTAPDIINIGEKFSLTPTIQRFNSSSFQTTAANASAYIDGIIESRLQTYVRFEVDPPIGSNSDYRLGNKGFTSGSTSNVPWYTIPGTNINTRKELLSINRNESGRLRYIDPLSNPFDDDPGYSSLGTGDSISTGPLSFTAGNWNTNASGTNSGSSVVGSAQETLVTATLDVDQLILGSSILGKSVEHDWGLLDYDLGYDVLDYKANLDVGLKQSFNVDDNVLVKLNFSDNVILDGIGETDFFQGLFSDIPRHYVADRIS